MTIIVYGFLKIKYLKIISKTTSHLRQTDQNQHLTDTFLTKKKKKTTQIRVFPNLSYLECHTRGKLVQIIKTKTLR